MAEQSSQSASESNPVYAHFVDSEDDMIGLIAYAIYKGEKIALVNTLKSQGASNQEIDARIAAFQQEAIDKAEEYFNKASTTAETFVDIQYSAEINEKNRATLLAENRNRATYYHFALMLFWGMCIAVGFYFLWQYIEYIKKDSMYRPGVTFKDNREIVFYLLERFSRRVLIVGIILYAINIVWRNFKLSFNSFTLNVHSADNLRVFDYLKNIDTDVITEDTLRHIFIESTPETGKAAANETGQRLLNKIVDKIDSIFDSAVNIVKKDKDD